MRTLKNKISAERHLIKKCTKPKYFKKILMHYSECFKKKLSLNKHEKSHINNFSTKNSFVQHKLFIISCLQVWIF